MEKVQLGLIGTGEIGVVHARNLAERVRGADLLALADRRVEAAQRCAAQNGVLRVHGDYRAILEDPQVQAVVICTTPDSHAGIVREAAQAGKHIFCEKPLGIGLQETQAAVSAVDKARVKLQVGFNRRFDPHFQRLHDDIRGGRIGKPHSLHIVSRDPEPPGQDYHRLSGGILMDMTIHDFDIARHLLDAEVEEIFAAASVLIAPWLGEADDFDTAALTLRFQGGAIGVIENSCRAVFGYDQRIEAFGEKGMIAVGNPAVHTAVVADESGYLASPPPRFFIDRYQESYLREMEAFVSAILSDDSPPVTGRDGLIALQMALAARRSLEEARPVKVTASQ